MQRETSYISRRRVFISTLATLLTAILIFGTVFVVFADQDSDSGASGDSSDKDTTFDNFVEGPGSEFTNHTLVDMFFTTDLEVILGENAKHLHARDMFDVANVFIGQHNYLNRVDTLFAYRAQDQLDSEANASLTEEQRQARVEASRSQTLMGTLFESRSGPAYVGRGIILALGIVMVLIMGVIKTVSELKRTDDISMEGLMRPILIMIMGLIVVIFSYDISNTVDKLGNTVARGIRRTALEGMGSLELPYFDVSALIEEDEQAEEEEAEGEEEEDDRGLLRKAWDWVWEKLQDAATAIKFLFMGIFQYFFSKMIGFIFRIVMIFTFYSLICSGYGLLFELIIRKMFFPIGVASIVSDGIRGPAMRYMKSYLAIYLRIGIFYLLIYLCTFIEVWAADITHIREAHEINPILGCIGVVLCTRTAIKSLITSSGDIAREIVGVQ